MGAPARAGEGTDDPQLREGRRGRPIAGVLRGLGLAGLLLMVLGWEYAPALRGDFVYEDFRMTVACTTPPMIDNAVWSSAFWRGRSVTRATWCWQLLMGHGPMAFHGLNLAMHAAVTGVLAAVLWQMTRSATVTVVSATFFAVNAVNVESVAYLSSRSELIAALGVLAACLAAVTGRWWLVPLALLVAVGGKESAVMGLMLVPLCLWWARGRPWGLVTLLGTVLVCSVLLSVTATWWWYLDAWPWFRMQASAMARVLLLSVLPLGQTVDYDYARVPSVVQWLAGAALLAWGWLGWRARRTAPLVWLGTCWVALTLLPRLIVPTPLSVFPEHQLYLPLCGVSLVLASLLTTTERTLWISTR